MIFKFKSPTTPSKRQLIQLNHIHLKKKPFIKKCLEGLKNSSGRSNSGKITIWHKGGGNKKKYRKINFQRVKNSTGMVCSIEYDPNRNSHIASVFDFSIDFYYMLSPKIPVGSYFHNISYTIDKKAQLTRSAGTFSILRERSFGYATIELSSKKQIKVSEQCFGTLGIVSNEFNFLTQLGKAGNSRWLNKRPTVRGVAMNPIDHPHGGGEGKTSGKNKTPWGKSNKSN